MLQELLFTLRCVKPSNPPFTFDSIGRGWDLGVWTNSLDNSTRLKFTYDVQPRGFDIGYWSNSQENSTNLTQLTTIQSKTR